MITRTVPTWHTEDWQFELSHAVRSLAELCQRLQLGPTDVMAEQAAADFSVMVPPGYLAKIQPGDPADPLLLQVLPQAEERIEQTGYQADPLAESAARPFAGLLHKYDSRVLLVIGGACAINCRYCFRRHYDYSSESLSNQQLKQLEDYLRAHPEVNEVILSGGDPLMLSNARLRRLFALLAASEHVARVRIHSRMVVTIPQRIDQGLIELLTLAPWPVVVVTHSNHPRELGQLFQQAMQRLRAVGVTLLNQSVLLRGVNDSVGVLQALSEQLFAAGVLPYYLHLLDPVAGAAHFDVEREEGVHLMRALHTRLPGFLLPRLVREVPGESAKSPIDLGLG